MVSLIGKRMYCHRVKLLFVLALISISSTWLFTRLSPLEYFQSLLAQSLSIPFLSASDGAKKQGGTTDLPSRRSLTGSSGKPG